ncbi:MAG TPA: DUF4010 domain-containing protein [Macromonas sp.]|nr:DUF4010 domain-containing protein [Macromonas sp.]
MWETLPITLPSGLSVPDAAAVLAAALGCGLLVGTERERRKGRGSARALAGLRTFTLACVMGAGAMLTGLHGLVTVGALFIAALGVVAHARDRSSDPGVTTEVALLLTYLIGVLCVWSLPLAAAVAVGTTALLEARERLHRFANHWLRPAEVRDGIVLCALVLIALPLMPNRPFWGEALNPRLITQLLALLLAIQSLAHLSQRLLEARQAVMLSSIASGFVSSTATIASMGMAVREGRSSARLMAGAGLLSCVATAMQVLLVAMAVQPDWLRVLWLPCLAGAGVALLWGGWLVRGARDGATASGLVTPRREGVSLSRAQSGPADEVRMFSLRGAVLVAALLTGVQAVVHGLGVWLGQSGALAGTLLAAMVDLHSAVAAVFAPASSTGSDDAVHALMLAISVHGLSKSATAVFAGGWRYLLWLLPGLGLHTASMVLTLAWLA